MRSGNESPTLVVLAAGMGSRYGGLKQMDAFGPNGETIIDYSIYDAIEAGFDKVVFIIREFFKEDFQKAIDAKYGKKIECRYVTQELEHLPEGYTVPDGREKPWGTAHAILVAEKHIDGPFAVINGDDYYGKTAFRDVVEFFDGNHEDFSVVGYKLHNTLSEHGTVNRGVSYADEEEYLTHVVECTKIKRNEKGVIEYPDGEDTKQLEEETLVSMNLWAFDKRFFTFGNSYFQNFLDERGSEMKSEFYIPNVVDLMIHNGEIKVKRISTDSNWFGVTYQEDKPVVVEKIAKLIESGVYPAQLW